MFQFPRFPPWQCQGHTFRCGVAPFGHRRITGCQPLPGAFRRVATSFIGSRRLGIHPMRICGVIAPARAGLPVPMGLLRDARGEPHLSGASPHPDPQGRSASILQGSRRITRNGWSRGDSNPGPPPCKGGALPAKLRPPIASGFLTPPSRGGRARTRTWDLGLIRAALSPPELRARLRLPCIAHQGILPGTMRPASRGFPLNAPPVSKTKQVPSHPHPPSPSPCASPLRRRHLFTVGPRPGRGRSCRMVHQGVSPGHPSRSLVPRRPGVSGPTPDLGVGPARRASRLYP